MRIIEWVLTVALVALSLSGCGRTKEEPAASESAIPDAEIQSLEEVPMETTKPEAVPVLLYMGQASMRIVTPENKVIYIDPYAGDAYDLPANLILVTHDHFDHCAVDRVENRSGDCKIITQAEALENGEHQVFELGYVTVETVEAGFNRWHDVRDCVGYVLTFTNGAKLYVTGDTSTTKQMGSMADMAIDYAFYCCDGVYNMGLEEAAHCAELVGAKHNIPYHNSTANRGEMFDRNLAEQFDAPNRLIVCPGEDLLLLPSGAVEAEMADYDFSAFSNVDINCEDPGSLSEEQLSVLVTQARYCQAMTEADLDALREIVSEDMTFTHMSGLKQTREEYFADIADGSLDYHRIGIENPVIEIEGDRASITYTSVLNANAYGAEGTYRIYGTHCYELRDGAWVAVNR